MMSSLQTLILWFAAGVLVLSVVWCTRRLSLAAQFLLLLGMGVCIGFVFLTIVQLPEYRWRTATLLVLMIFIASPIAVRLFLRVLTKEEDEQLKVPKAGRWTRPRSL